MKQETKNEMDLLLRRLGRRDEPGATDEHLDADELNAYAENALPEKTRARYTAHLAECSRCRSLVVQLSSSANVVASTDSAAVKEPSGFRKFLASLFTPMVLRYAAPALGLILVAAIGFVVLRRQQAESYVAQDTHSGAAPAATSPEAKQYVDRYGESTNAPSPGRTNESQEKTKQAPAVAGPLPNTPPTVTSVDAEVAKDKAVAQEKTEEQKAATDAPPPAKPEPTPTPEQSPRAAEPGSARNEVKVQPAASAAAKDERELRGAQRDDDRQTGSFTRRPVAGVQSAGVADRSGVSDLSANTRVVAGRRFRKQGGVWIDTAYDSSKDVTTVSRGSEQYRALVADEPAIKNIADQLEGEILVVWKTRTYRIH